MKLKFFRKWSFFDQNQQPLNSLLSLTPVKLSADGSWVIDPVDSATIEVRVSTEAKLDSAGSDACDSKCNWGGLMLFIPENVSAIARTLEALSITAVTRALDALFMIVLRTWRQAVRTVIAMRGLSVFVTASLMSTVGMWQLAGWTLRQLFRMTLRMCYGRFQFVAWKCWRRTLILAGDGARVNRAPAFQCWS